jgi:uncharacterized protein (DUF39 family)
MSGRSVNKSITEINERIRKGKAVVLNAEEMIKVVREQGKVKAAQEVDVVTTGTFSPMCSSGMFFNIGQEPPTMKVSELYLNNVRCHSGLAAVDAYMGATEPAADDPLNKVYPGRFMYGGGHVIEDLLRGRRVHLSARAYGTDCYPRKSLEKDVFLSDLPNAWLLNPRNCYQNYNCAANMSSRTIYTYMGPLKPGCRNVNFATAGQLSPLFNDPYLETIGLGTRIFLGGAVGYVLGSGTQHNPRPKRNDRGVPQVPAATLMVKGPLKDMSPRWIRGVSITGYGCSLSVGVGIPIPILNEEIAWRVGVSDEEIDMPIKDYGYDYPNGLPRVLGHASIAQLKSGKVRVGDAMAAAVPITSYSMSLEIADTLKSWIEKGVFMLSTPQESIESR